MHDRVDNSGPDSALKLSARSCMTGRTGGGVPSDVAEAVDLVLELGPLLRVRDAHALLGGEAQDADLALVDVLVDVEGGLAGVGERVGPAQRRVDDALLDEAVG